MVPFLLGRFRWAKYLGCLRVNSFIWPVHRWCAGGRVNRWSNGKKEKCSKNPGRRLNMMIMPTCHASSVSCGAVIHGLSYRSCGKRRRECTPSTSTLESEAMLIGLRRFHWYSGRLRATLTRSAQEFGLRIADGEWPPRSSFPARAVT